MSKLIGFNDKEQSNISLDGIKKFWKYEGGLNIRIFRPAQVDFFGICLEYEDETKAYLTYHTEEARNLDYDKLRNYLEVKVL